jgi:DNA invertase Pin-like site-specific DNA recombinase
MAAFPGQGWSGLQQLLSDIRAGLVDTVVVYKVDRLTRSLTDFAKMVELFDARGVSFVAVTQQFNTTTSMGRLTLNMLLSFAQFEREVIGERIRDKIAGSKRKGIWMGGTLPLGYRAHSRKLVVNPEEAQRVRQIFERYLELGSVRLLKIELEQNAIVSGVRVSRKGNSSGGQQFSRGALYPLLSNPIYIGEIRHRKESHPGQHEAIVSRELWERVQQRLRERKVRSGEGRKTAASNSPLAGKLFDENGEPLYVQGAAKGPRRYCYYAPGGSSGGTPRTASRPGDYRRRRSNEPLPPRRSGSSATNRRSRSRSMAPESSRISCRRSCNPHDPGSFVCSPRARLPRRWWCSSNGWPSDATVSACRSDCRWRPAKRMASPRRITLLSSGLSP